MGRNKSPSENTIRILCGKAAGMCEFEGCNKRLFYDGVTLSTFNNAFVAHIVASSAKGPRGDKVLSPQLSDKLDNLMLMCADHHKLIDIPTTGPRDYPVERLKDMKRAHEEKIEKLCFLFNVPKTEVVMFSSPINGVTTVSIDYDLAAKAVLPNKQPSSSYGISLPVQSGYAYTSKEYWSDCLQQLQNLFNLFIKNPMMQRRLDEVKKDFSIRNQVEISSVPLYKVKTPLQRAIQLLKRHRDIMYNSLPEERKENAPISIIITTLAAHAYNNEPNLYEALCSIIEDMPKHIKRVGNAIIVANPAIPEENFAEKWNENSEKAAEFFRWLEAAKLDILTNPLNALGLHKVSESLELSFGRTVVQRALMEEGYATKLARESKQLYVDGLTGGLKTTSSPNTKKVRGHTFFGK